MSVNLKTLNSPSCFPSNLSDQWFFEVEVHPSQITSNLSRTKPCQERPIERRADTPTVLPVQGCILSHVIRHLFCSFLILLLVIALSVLFPERCGDMLVLGSDFTLRLAVVEVAEVRHNDGHWQRDGEHAGNGAHGAHQLSPDRLGVHVPIANCRHRYHSPPECLRDAGKRCVRTVHLSEVGRTRKEYNSNKEEEDEQGKLSEAGLQRLAQNLEAFRVPREFEDPEDPHQPDDPDKGKGHRWLCPFVLGQLRAQCDKIGNDGEEVDGVHDVFEEVRLARGAGEAHDEFKGEPADADRLCDEEGVLKGGEARGDHDGFVRDGGMRYDGELLQNKV